MQRSNVIKPWRFMEYEDLRLYYEKIHNEYEAKVQHLIDRGSGRYQADCMLLPQLEHLWEVYGVLQNKMEFDNDHFT